MDRDKEDIIALCRRLGRAHYDKDAESIADCYTADAVIYGLAPPLGERGMGRDGLAAWLATWQGPVIVDSSDAELIVSADLGYISGLNRIRGTKTDGSGVDLWFRTTMCFRRAGDGWRIAHDHSSVPFLMDGSERA
ncbi:MAG: nuclear transport factor 2 family protein, partial [Pseudomonadota bacterium]